MVFCLSPDKEQITIPATVSVTPITVYQPQGSCSIIIPATTPTTLMEFVWTQAATVDDILLNTLGAGIGYLLFLICYHALPPEEGGAE